MNVLIRIFQQIKTTIIKHFVYYSGGTKNLKNSSKKGHTFWKGDATFSKG